MKILYFDDFRLGILKGDTVVDVSAQVQDIRARLAVNPKALERELGS